MLKKITHPNPKLTALFLPLRPCPDVEKIMDLVLHSTLVFKTKCNHVHTAAKDKKMNKQTKKDEEKIQLVPIYVIGV